MLPSNLISECGNTQIICTTIFIKFLLQDEKLQQLHKPLNKINNNSDRYSLMGHTLTLHISSKTVTRTRFFRRILQFTQPIFPFLTRIQHKQLQEFLDSTKHTIKGKSVIVIFFLDNKNKQVSMNEKDNYLI